MGSSALILALILAVAAIAWCGLGTLSSWQKGGGRTEDTTEQSPEQTRSPLASAYQAQEQFLDTCPPSTHDVGPAAAPGSPREGGPPSGIVLCPDLVVPDGCECILLVPRLDPCLRGKLTVDDADGVPVFHVAALGPAQQAGGGYARQGPRGPRLVLSSTRHGGTVFAHCQLSGPGPGASVTITDSASRPFGSLRLRASEGGRLYQAVTGTGEEVNIQADAHGDLTATDRHERLCAIARHLPAKRARRFRIGPFVDVGLMLLCTLGIDLLETERGGQGEASEHGLPAAKAG